MIRAIALDDEPPALNVLTTFCTRLNTIELVSCFTKTDEALDFIQQNEVDLLFLDINMPSINGMDFYKQLQEKVLVIFTTAYSEYAIDAFDVRAIDYLLKPFTFHRFSQAVERVQLQMNVQSKFDEQQFLVLRIDYKLVKILIADILFIEGLDDYLKIHLRNQKPQVARITMKAILEKLPGHFVRVHRSYIVSFKSVDGVRNKIIHIGDEEIPLGSTYEAGFLKLLNH